MTPRQRLSTSAHVVWLCHAVLFETDKKFFYPSPRETIKKAYITETSELLTEAKRAGEKRRKETEDEEHFLVC